MASRWEAANHENEDEEDEETKNKTWPARSGSGYDRVLGSLSSPESKRGYRHAIDEFIDWYCSEPRL
jgi:hypothetical protein